MTSTVSTRDQILGCAQDLIQRQGYNGFSFRDVAGDIGIKSSSIHYYYPSKTDLAVAVATQYQTAFSEITNQIIAREDTAPATLKAFAEVFVTTLKQDNKLCLCGMLASEINSVEPELQSAISMFFNEQQDVLAAIFSKGQSKGELRADIEAADFAQTYLSALEGAMMLARVNKRPSDILIAADQMISLATA